MTEEAAEEIVEAEEAAVAAKYGLHIEIPAEMQQILRDAAELGYM